MDKLAAHNSFFIDRRRILRLGGLGLLAGAVLGGALAGAGRDARADTSADAGAFLLSLTSTAIGQLTNDAVPVEERKARFRVLFRNNFDVPAIGRFVLGRYGRGASKSDMDSFLATFEDVMVERFAPQFAGYGDTRFRVGTVHQVDDRSQFMVSSAITPPGQETEVQIDWRLLHRDGSFKVLDIVGEGVSMALTLRAEYGSVLKASGGKVEELVTLLRDRIGTQAAAN